MKLYQSRYKVYSRNGTSKNLLWSHFQIQVPVLSVGGMYPPDIYYEYTVQRPEDYNRFRWKLTDSWTDCDCDGKQYREAICLDKETNSEVAPEYCQSLPRPAQQARACNTHCSMQWHIASEMPCSASCGRGARRREVQCVRKYSNAKMTVMEDGECARVPGRPLEVVDCENVCEHYVWAYGSWNECSVSCGSGMQERKASCVDYLGRQVSDAQCQYEDRNTHQTCYSRQCPPRWEMHEWSPCSKTCGGGERMRGYLCRAGSQVLPREYCDVSDLPAFTERCNEQACPVWWTEKWEPCSVTCGSGSTVRRVWCAVDGQRVSDELCRGLEMPPLSEHCTLAPCPLTTTTPSRPSWLDLDQNDLRPSSEKHPHIHHHSLTTHRYEDDNKVDPNIGQLPTDSLRYKWMPSKWSTCSATCGRGERTRKVQCEAAGSRKVAPDQHCPPDRPASREPCHLRACPSWRTGEWGHCSVTCGQGVQQRLVECVQSGACDDQSKPPAEQLCLTDETCPTVGEWRTGPWSECSASCNGGEQYRQVACSHYICDERARPVTLQMCNEFRCPQWSVSSWGQCSVPCGPGGSQSRQVRCHAWNGTILEDSACPGDRLRSTKPCNRLPCMIPTIKSPRRPAKVPPRQPVKQPKTPAINEGRRYRWRPSAWGPCSRTCGQGKRERKVLCVDHETNKTVHNIFCSVRQPKEQSGCPTRYCDFDWVETPWSECSSTCGGGYQTRTSACHRVNKVGWVDPEPVDQKYCNATLVPASSQRCNEQDCSEQFYWHPGPWGTCSQSCGRRGRQVRKLECRSFRSPNKPKTLRSNCQHLPKPLRKQKCNQRACGYLSCYQVQQELGARSDGEYTLLVGGWNMSIYCYGMDGRSPIEYLTLPEGDQENYAEVYDKSLLWPDTCPDEGRRMDNCSCKENKEFRYGKTYFRKIRLDVSTLRVKTDDLRFTRQTGPQKVKYGEAGDCYSTTACPQGQFSINLTGTSFVVPNYTTWRAEGSSKPQAKIHRSPDGQKVTGRCGGYCGFCRPHQGEHRGLKLDALPP